MSTPGQDAGFKAQRDCIDQPSSQRRRPKVRNSKRPTRAGAIAGRWMTVVVYGFTAAVIWGWMAPFLRPRTEPIVGTLSSLPYYLLVSLVLALFAAIACIRGWGKVLAWLGLRKLLSYPPAWVGVPIGLLCAQVLDPSADLLNKLIPLAPNWGSTPASVARLAGAVVLVLAVVLTIVSGPRACSRR